MCFKKLIKIFGGQRETARIVGVTQQAVCAWGKNGVPVRYVLTLEKASKGRITRYEIRPDLYPVD